MGKIRDWFKQGFTAPVIASILGGYAIQAIVNGLVHSLGHAKVNRASLIVLGFGSGLVLLGALLLDRARHAKGVEIIPPDVAEDDTPPPPPGVTDPDFGYSAGRIGWQITLSPYPYDSLYPKAWEFIGVNIQHSLALTSARRIGFDVTDPSFHTETEPLWDTDRTIDHLAKQNRWRGNYRGWGEAKGQALPDGAYSVVAWGLRDNDERVTLAEAQFRMRDGLYVVPE